MDPNNKNPINNPELNGIFVEHFPRVVRYGVVGAVAISALIWAHKRFSNSTAEIEPPQDQTGPNGPAV